MKKRTLREITNIIQRLKDLGASKVKLGDIEVYFTAENNKEAPDVSELVSTMGKNIEDKRSAEEKEEDELFEDGF